MKKMFVFFVILGLFVAVSEVSASDYVGSDTCFQCHTSYYNDWQASGHPWKLRKVEKARYAKLPLPPGYSWDDISYVIGGAMKKARYIDLQGYIITTAKDGSEAKTQYNLEDGSWSFYHKGEKKPYECGPCHMTAYKKEGNQDGMPGMIGTWVEDGIGCEECHGAGSDHVKKPSKKNIEIGRSVEACGKCHQRGGMGPEPPASGGFIKHHEQINELKAGPHGDLACVDCHDPHKRAILVKAACASCHEDTAKSFAGTVHGKAGMKCFECHMPKVSKSAIKVNKYTGDVRAHIVRINSDPKATMFKEVITKGKKGEVAQGFVTLEYVCLGCHGSKDKKWAAKQAKKMH